ncbi:MULTISPECIES: WhiB family transcriptional regulator [Rhodococcus]|uniref:Transcriptional regulator WhiB n=1 Tax=Rhodococcus wratislaviensis NBRC 100605 TaxID=1219028 RepID=X0PVD3_RHOWR|nr:MULTISPECIES: WhiB family transcriptional regulator [Rhodococcus]WAM19088.1 WhiB family transcriptional regulator [Rhodococcus sp. JS3073]GAF47168.1 putative WhiB family regulatory protein [Rhodococcus wratislaviensis NBRC 100605]
MSSLTHSIAHLQPLTPYWDWQLQARCRDVEADIFFSPEVEGRTARLRREKTAKRICTECPVHRECRQHALTAREAYGVWGGTSEAERRYLLPEPEATRKYTNPTRRLRVSLRHPPPGKPQREGNSVELTPATTNHLGPG